MSVAQGILFSFLHFSFWRSGIGGFTVKTSPRAETVPRRGSFPRGG
jgi:hypothetical protein